MGWLTGFCCDPTSPIPLPMPVVKFLAYLCGFFHTQHMCYMRPSFFKTFSLTGIFPLALLSSSGAKRSTLQARGQWWSCQSSPLLFATSTPPLSRLPQLWQNISHFLSSEKQVDHFFRIYSDAATLFLYQTTGVVYKPTLLTFSDTEQKRARRIPSLARILNNTGARLTVFNKLILNR